MISLIGKTLYLIIPISHMSVYYIYKKCVGMVESSLTLHFLSTSKHKGDSEVWTLKIPKTRLLCNHLSAPSLPLPFKKPISPRSFFSQLSIFDSGNHSSTRTLKMAQAAQNPGNKIHPFTHTYLYVFVYVNVCMPMWVKKFGNNFSIQVGFLVGHV